eukprot:COSAG06_NODE_15551_length_1062_cov_1.597092_2_plen_75_part_00
MCVTQTLREAEGGKKSVGGARDRDNGELRFSLRSIQVRKIPFLFVAMLFIFKSDETLPRQARDKHGKTPSFDLN